MTEVRFDGYGICKAGSRLKCATQAWDRHIGHCDVSQYSECAEPDKRSKVSNNWHSCGVMWGFSDVPIPVSIWSHCFTSRILQLCVSPPCSLRVLLPDNPMRPFSLSQTQFTCHAGCSPLADWMGVEKRIENFGNTCNASHICTTSTCLSSSLQHSSNNNSKVKTNYILHKIISHSNKSTQINQNGSMYMLMWCQLCKSGTWLREQHLTRQQGCPAGKCTCK